MNLGTMNKKWFIYLLIVGVSVVNFLFADINTRRMIAEERVAQSLGISVEQLQTLLLFPQEEDIALIVGKKSSKGWTSLMHIAKGKFLCIGYAEKGYSECQYEDYQKYLYDIYLKIAQLLIENGADLNAKNDNGKSALTIAFNSKNKPIIELLLQGLLQYDVAIDIQDVSGFTPLKIVIVVVVLIIVAMVTVPECVY